MTTNLLIGDAGVAVDGASISVAQTADTAYPITNLVGGCKVDSFQLSTGYYNTQIMLSGATTTVNYLYLGGARALQAQGVISVGVHGGATTDFGLSTQVFRQDGFAGQSLAGPGNDDYISLISAATYPNWFVNIVAANPIVFPFSKLFLGSYFDPGMDPNQPIRITRSRPSGQLRRAIYTLEIAWSGMRYPKAVELYSRYCRGRRHSPVILFTRDYHAPLLGSRVMFGRITSLSFPPIATDFCGVTMTFEENP